jgi:hypothetical protein
MRWVARTERGQPLRRSAGALALLVAFVGGAGVSCLLELDRSISCGDGFVDVDAGETCDPNDPAQAFAEACRARGLGNGDASCDPTSCTILATVESCALCGDGEATGTEQCDGADLRGQSCPAGDAGLRCKSNCTFDLRLCETCGDGVFEASMEECEPVLVCDEDDDCPGSACDLDRGVCQPTGLAGSVSCTLLTPPVGFDQYTAGTASTASCTDACLLDRSPCSFCGNEELDGAYADLGPDGTFLKPAEVCDGDLADSGELTNFCRQKCTGTAQTLLDLTCDYECRADCRGFRGESPEDLWQFDPASCCIVGGGRCDVSGGFPCCWALENPEQADQACQPVGSGMLGDLRCRSI